jgi:hypothetical protein
MLHDYICSIFIFYMYTRYTIAHYLSSNCMIGEYLIDDMIYSENITDIIFFSFFFWSQLNQDCWVMIYPDTVLEYPQSILNFQADIILGIMLLY